METLIFLLLVALLIRSETKFRRQAKHLTALEGALARLQAPLADPAAAASAETSPSPLPFTAPTSQAGAVPEAIAAGPTVPVATAPTEAAGPFGPPPSDVAAPSGEPEAPFGLPPAAPKPPARARGFEETLGTRWAVWVGGVALALGGIFLVRYSIEQGLVGPGTRIVLGLLFAAALIAAGEWLRRREAPVPAFASANVPAILTAAGTSTAFATVYAAYGLYGLIGPALAFVALGVVSLVTMAAAMLHGPALAGLGLAAALGAPLLVETQDPSPVALSLYLVFATGTAYAVARLRLWRWLAITAAAGAWIWGFVFVAQGWNPGALVHAAIQLALALLFLVVDPHRNERDEDARTDRFVAAVLFAFGFLVACVGAASAGDVARPLYAGLAVAMMVAAAYRHPAGASGAAAAAFTASGTLLLWPVAQQAGAEAILVIPDLPSAPRPEAIGTYLTAAILLNALVALPSLWRVVIGPGLRQPVAGWFLAAASLGPLASLIATYWRITAFDTSVPFAIVAAALAAAFAATAGWLMRRRAIAESPALQLAVGVMASAAVGALAAGFTFAFDRGVLTITLALSALGTAWVAERTGIRALRWVVGAIGIAVAARLAWDPTVMRGAIGTTPIFNWLLFGYGVPALAFGLSAWILARSGRDPVQRLCEGLAILFAALLVSLEIRHALHGGDIYAATSDHLEAGLVVTEALGFTLLLTRLDLRWPSLVFRYGALLFGLLSLLGAAVSLLIVDNPYLLGNAIPGGAIFNSLIPGYLIPATLAAAIAWTAQNRRPRWFVLTAGALALALELAYAFLEVRFLFKGGDVSFWRSTSQGELWCYSLVLIANGAALLAAGFIWRSRIARLASLACFVVAVLKVFLIDMSALEGLTRALSFVGLGLALVALGLAYQKLLARRGPDEPVAIPTGPSLPAPDSAPITPP